jgi:hypothetical protein
MTKRRDDISDLLGADEPRTGSLGMKLVLFGALLPVFLAALLVGGFLIVRGPGEGAQTAAQAVTAAEAPLDCSSPRDAWRSACQKVAAADGPATTGSIEAKATGRSSTVRTATAEPAADRPKEPVKPAAASPVKAPIPPARSAVREAENQDSAAARAEAPKPAAEPRPAKAPAPAPERVAAMPAAEPAAKPRVAAGPQPALEPKPAVASAPERGAAVPPEEPVPAAPKAPFVAAPEPAPAVNANAIAAMPSAAAPSAKPTESAKPERASPLERMARRRDVERTAAVPASPPPVVPRERASAVERDEEPVRPARLARHRAKAKEAARTVAAVRAKVVKQRVRTARPRFREVAPDLDGGFRVTSQQIHTLPDGRQIVVHTRPRSADVRELVAEHQARFGQRRVASPWGGGGWYAGAADW